MKNKLIGTTALILTFIELMLFTILLGINISEIDYIMEWNIIMYITLFLNSYAIVSLSDMLIIKKEEILEENIA